MEKMTKQQWIDEVKNNWTFLPFMLMNGKWGQCVKLIGDVKIVFTHPGTKETTVASLKTEKSENYNGYTYNHSDIKIGKKKEQSSQVRVHNSKISSLSLADIEELIGKGAMKELREQIKDELREEAEATR
tara:strand:+ start:702 stop:1091 length:390 start_codon:yes stop_codon:yes gene_type:complete